MRERPLTVHWVLRGRNSHLRKVLAQCTPRTIRVNWMSKSIAEQGIFCFTLDLYMEQSREWWNCQYYSKWKCQIEELVAFFKYMEQIYFQLLSVNPWLEGSFLWGKGSTIYLCVLKVLWSLMKEYEGRVFFITVIEYNRHFSIHLLCDNSKQRV